MPEVLFYPIMTSICSCSILQYVSASNLYKTCRDKLYLVVEAIKSGVRHFFECIFPCIFKQKSPLQNEISSSTQNIEGNKTLPIPKDSLPISPTSSGVEEVKKPSEEPNRTNPQISNLLEFRRARESYLKDHHQDFKEVISLMDRETRRRLYKQIDPPNHITNVLGTKKLGSGLIDVKPFIIHRGIQLISKILNQLGPFPSELIDQIHEEGVLNYIEYNKKNVITTSSGNGSPFEELKRAFLPLKSIQEAIKKLKESGGSGKISATFLIEENANQKNKIYGLLSSFDRINNHFDFYLLDPHGKDELGPISIQRFREEDLLFYFLEGNYSMKLFELES